MKETKADRTKVFILEKVSPIFNSQGYAATSLSDVINATGLTKGAIYGNFDNKEDLAQKAFNYNLMQVFKPLNEALEVQKSASKKMKALTDFYRNYFLLMKELGGCPINNVLNDSKGVNDVLTKDAQKASNSILKKLEEILLLGIQQGKFKKKSDPKDIALVIFGMIQGGVFLSNLQDKIHPLHLMMDEVDNVMKAIKGK